MQSELVRSELAKRLQPVDADWAGALTDPQTTVTPLATPFLRRWFVVRIERFSPSGPLPMLLACGPAGEATVLNGDAAALGRVLAADAADVGDEAAAVALVELHLAVAMPDRIVVRTVDDIPWRPRLGPDLVARRDQLAAELAGVVRPPAAVARIGGGFDVALFVVEEMSLLRVTFGVSRAGAVSAASAVVRDGLPLVYRM